jgi:hypothetical protein
MARIRTLKPTFWTDDRVVNLSRDARLLLVGMISQADDAGRLPASPVSLIGALYPHDEDVTAAKITRWTNEIDHCGIAKLYRIGKAQYAYFPKWKKHQRIDRPQKSSLPEPPPDALFEVA